MVITSSGAGANVAIQIDGYSTTSFGPTVFSIYPTPANDLFVKYVTASVPVVMLPPSSRNALQLELLLCRITAR